MRQFYRRRLPHWQPPGAIIFSTYRLYGSLPIEVIHMLAEEKRRLESQPPRKDESRRDRALRESKGLFALADRAMDFAQTGPRWLECGAIAAIVVENLFHHSNHLYKLWAFTIMPNHVHVLLEPLLLQTVTTNGNLWREPEDKDFVALEHIMHALKSYTAHRGNEILNRHGTFWHHESYDHWVRDEKEFCRIAAYIENNPVKAGLVESVEKWAWSSAAFERNEDGSCIDLRIAN